MKLLPTDLALRLKNIYSQQEMDSLQKVFEISKRPVSFRLNSLSSTSQEVEEALQQASITYTKLDFPENSYLLDEGFTESDIWKRRIYKDGKIYMQGISSQVPAYFFSPDLSQFSSQGEMKSQLKILDACAAPGGKTSQLSALYPDAEITAFEPSKVRYDKMCHNLKKLGISTSHNSTPGHPSLEQSSIHLDLLQGEMKSQVRCIHDEIRNISKYIENTEYFDMIIIDAPCSSEGSLSFENTKFLKSWDMKHINKNYKRQKHIIDDTLPYLKTGGELIYTTCTLAPEENEGVVHYTLCNYPEMQLEGIEIPKTKYIQTIPALLKFEKYIYKSEIAQKCMRVIPSEYSEGFFISKFTKKITNS